MLAILMIKGTNYACHIIYFSKHSENHRLSRDMVISAQSGWPLGVLWGWGPDVETRDLFSIVSWNQIYI